MQDLLVKLEDDDCPPARQANCPPFRAPPLFLVRPMDLSTTVSTTVSVLPADAGRRSTLAAQSAVRVI
jgi:hypothetical protein